MTVLNSAIRKGIDRAPRDCSGFYYGAGMAADILGTAYLGQLNEPAVVHFWVRVANTSNESLCQFMLAELHRVWPDIGRSVRTWPRLAEELERDRLIPRLQSHQPVHRQEIHVSLWRVLTDMQDAGESRSSIADLLARHGL